MTLKCNLRKLMYEHEIETFAEVIRLTGGFCCKVLT